MFFDREGIIMGDKLKIDMYCQYMSDIKQRIFLIKNKISAEEMNIYKLEEIVLHLRKIIEGIAFASLVLNKDEYEKISSEWKKKYKADEIFKELHKVNPKYYPISVKEKIEYNTHIRSVIKDERGQLSIEELKKTYGWCGNYLHVRNPYRKALNELDDMKKVIDILNKIVLLLNCHIMHFIDGEIMICHMEELNTGNVTAYLFSDKDKN
jgi:hypothetical protein